MNLKILLFAALRDAAGMESLSLAWSPGMTCAQLCETLKQKFSSLASLLQYSLVAVNGCYAGPGEILQPEDEVALLPPVSGG